MENSNGNLLVQANLQQFPVHQNESEDLITVEFSAAADQLEKCSFVVDRWGESSAHSGFVLKLKEFLDLKNPTKKDTSVQSEK